MDKRASTLMGLAVAGWIAGCGPAANPSPAGFPPPGVAHIATGSHTWTATVPPLPTTTASVTQTLSPTPTQLETPSPNQWPTISTPTVRPTPTRGMPPTMTSAPAEICPPPTNAPIPDDWPSDPAAYEQKLLDILTSKGDILGFPDEADGHGLDAYVIKKDVTGDGTAEFLISISTWEKASFVFIGCRGGRYTVLHQFVLQNREGSARWSAGYRIVSDINGDGMNEIVYSFVDNVGNRFVDITAQVLAWNGQEFRELMRDDPILGFEWNRYAVDADVEFEDLDGNGTLELIFPNRVFWNPEGMGMFMDCDGGVSRNNNAIWMWDGEYYRYMWTEPVPPLYRFQAALDGDLFAFLGLFDRAEEMYLRAAFDSSLKPGSMWDWMRDYNCPGADYQTPDPDEPERMKAYARFRLVELYVHVGRVNEAEWHRSYMRANDPLGSPGYIYAYLANAFWWGYADSEDISAACARVVEEAQAYEEDVFGPFEQYGYYNSGPTLTDICPFSAPSVE
ncbi:MAG: hypothetical protein ACK2UB_03630 [Anaerolineales bacterium]